ncbi:unnamed protein product [Rotaria sp. Silwood2]|nr:unnamed protein product [Rotaria sp. Silwood2]
MGFEYTGNGDTARCKDCGLEVSDWILDMNPFTIHSKQRPDCPFILSLVTNSQLNIRESFISSRTTVRNASIVTVGEHVSKRQKLDTIDFRSVLNTLFESNSLQQIRRRTFSHWPHHAVPSSAEMIEAGFFNCNVGDRVICIYCHIICQQWTPHVDDPRELHKTLSPNCIYVKAKLMNPTQSSIVIINEQSSTTTTTDIHSSQTNNLDSLRSNYVVFRTPCNPNFSEIPKHYASFTTWSNENSPSVDTLVQAGFFYSGRATIVTCFYCNESLKNWGSNDNPIIEHARWFPCCPYAKQLCGEDLFRKIQESKRIQKEQAKSKTSTERTGSNDMIQTNVTTNSGTLLIPNESTLSRFVAARLDLSISQRLLDQGFQLSIIKRDDFVSDNDLYVACIILRKPIEYINETKMNKSMSIVSNAVHSIVENDTDVEMTTSSQSSIKSISNDDEYKTEKTTINDRSQSTNSTSSNPCVLCLTKEKQLACIPCGHMVTCVACGHSLRLCPICRREINAFARIYI